MRKILMITTHFAPSRHVGAKRPVKFCKFLPQYGWEPVVLTKEVEYYHGIDETLNQDLSPNLKIYRVKEWHPLGVWHRMVRYTKNALNKTVQIRPIKGKKLFLAHLLFYDYAWLLPAFFVAFRIIQKEKIDLLFSTSPPAEPHLLALLLKICTGKKWVCDFRDPWTKLPVCVYHPQTIQRTLDKYLEKITLSISDHIICVSDRLRYDLVDRTPDELIAKSTTIYNGYDRDDFGKYPPGRDSKFTMTYLGTWGRNITPESLLDAMSGLVLHRDGFSKQVRVNLVGEVKFDPELAQRLDTKIAEQGLTEVVRIIPFRSYKEALAMLHSSDVLLLVVGSPADKPETMRYRIPAKLFEYLHARKHILALVPTDGEAARIIRQTNTGTVVSPDDVNAIEEAIWDLYQSHHDGRLVSKVDSSAIEEFDRKKQTAMLAAIFDELLGANNVGSKED